MASPEFTWLSRIGAELLMMSLMSVMFVLKSPTIACEPSTNRCSDGPKPPTARAVSFSSTGILSAGSAASPLLAASRAGTDLAGHGALGDRLAVAKYLCCRRTPGPGTAHRRRHRMHVRDGVHRDLELVADAHRGPHTGVGRLDVGDPPIVTPSVGDVGRPVQAAEDGRSALSVYWPTPARVGSRRKVPAQHHQGDHGQDRRTRSTGS